MSFSRADPILSPDESEAELPSSAKPSPTESGLPAGAGTLTLPGKGVETGVEAGFSPEEFMAVLQTARMEAAGVLNVDPQAPLQETLHELEAEEAHQDAEAATEVEEVHVEEEEEVFIAADVEPKAEAEEAQLHAEENVEVDGAAVEAVEGEEAGPINAKLKELITLLKEGFAAQDGTRPVQLSRKATREIAREVAGKVQESVVLKGRHNVGDTKSDAVSPAPTDSQKRIPLDDLSAIIDQITGRAG
jgi:hypothetical protein